MAGKGKKVTSAKIAKIASNLLRKSRIKKVRRVAASDLSQVEKKSKRKSKK